MRAIWKGNISFALVTIPVSVFSATRSNELSFKYLHKADLSPVSYKRFCEAEQREVAWEEITRGYEFDRGRFVEVTGEEFKQAGVELSRTIQIVQFVDEKEIDPIFFDKPYYLEPQKGGERAYALMRDALASSGRVGLARVVLRSREHLAAVKPQNRLITMQTLRFAHEIADASALNLPGSSEASAKELTLAHTLIDTMVEAFEPSRYRDEYRDRLLEVIQRKVAGVPAPEAPEAPAAAATVIDLMEVLKQSLEETRRPRPVKEEIVAAAPRPQQKKTRASETGRTAKVPKVSKTGKG